ncbi:hypothetical protein DFH27DRAFT_201251 [Peziza echinospora]|nr:hypothetical protein DFH27DRAFT_201251 [Peziza echinospora]
MLPTFQIRGLRFCATDSREDSDDSLSKNHLDLGSLNPTEGSSLEVEPVDSDSSVGGVTFQSDNGPWTDIQLQRPKDYDDIIKSYPHAALAYVDEDDGDMITVGSSFELFNRIEELQPQNPIVFDVRNRKALPVWKRELQVMYERQLLRQDTSILSVIEAPVPTTKGKGPLVDLSPDDESDSAQTPQSHAESSNRPFLDSFEASLFQFLNEPRPSSTVQNDINENEAPRPQSQQSDRAPTPPIEAPSESYEPLRHTLSSFIAALPGRNQQLFTSLRSSILNLAQVSATAARTAATLSRDLPVAEFENGIRTIHSSLNTVAREAAAAAAQAAEATRAIDTSELQRLVDSMGTTVREVGEAYHHVGQVVGGEVNRVVREVVEGRGNSLSKEEAQIEKAAIEKAMREFISEADTAQTVAEDIKGKGKEKATEGPKSPKPTAPPRPFVEEVVDEEAPGGYGRRPWDDAVDAKPTGPPVPPKVHPEASYRPQPSTPTENPPPVPKKTPLEAVSTYEESTPWAPRAPEHDDGDSSESSDDEDDDDDGIDDGDEEGEASADFLPNPHTPRMHAFSQNGSLPSPTYRQSPYHPANQWNGPHGTIPGVRADLLRRGLHRREQSMRMLPRENAFPIDPQAFDINMALHQACHQFPPVFPQNAPHSSPPHLSPPGMLQSFPAVRSSPPRMPHMGHMSHQQQPLGVGWTPFPHPGYAPNMLHPYYDDEGRTFFGPRPPPPPPFAPQPPHHDFAHFMPPPPPPPPHHPYGMPPTGDMGMYPRFMPNFGPQIPSAVQQEYNANVKRALSTVPLPTLQEQLQKPTLVKRMWEELERAASVVEIPHGAVGWTRMPFDEMVRLRLEADEEAELRARNEGEDDHAHEDDNMDEPDRMVTENLFSPPARMATGTPAYANRSRPASNSPREGPASMRGSIYGGMAPPHTSPARQGGIFNHRQSPVPITPASPASFHSASYLPRKTPMNSNHVGSAYGPHVPSPPGPAIPVDTRRSTPSVPAAPVPGYGSLGSPAVSVDHRHMPSAPAVPANDIFNLSSPMLPHLASHRSLHSLHSLHRGTPPVPDVPEDGPYDRPNPYPSYSPVFSGSIPPPPPPHKIWQSMPANRGLHRANTVPTHYPISPQPLPGFASAGVRPSFQHRQGFYEDELRDEEVCDSIPCLGHGPTRVNPFFAQDPAGPPRGRPVVRPVGYGPPAAFWPPSESMNEDEDEDECLSPRLRRERSMSEASTHSEEERRGRSPTARGPRAQPGNYTPPPPPPFRANQEVREQNTDQNESQSQQTQTELPLMRTPTLSNRSKIELNSIIPGMFMFDIPGPSTASTPTLPIFPLFHQQGESSTARITTIPISNPFSPPPSPVHTPRLTIRNVPSAPQSPVDRELEDAAPQVLIEGGEVEASGSGGYLSWFDNGGGEIVRRQSPTTSDNNSGPSNTSQGDNFQYEAENEDEAASGSGEQVTFFNNGGGEIVRCNDLDSKLDECIAKLVDMGYNYMPWIKEDGNGDDGDNEDLAMERLRIVASAVFGDVEAAIDLLDEDLRGWQDDLDRRVEDEIVNSRTRDTRSESWRLAGWY